MEEGPAHLPAASAARPERLAFGIGERGERRIGPRLDQGGIVELVAAQGRAGRPERAIGEEKRVPIAEMQPPRGEARGMVEEAGHGVARAVRIDEAGAQHHVATAFAMHGVCRSEAREPLLEAQRSGKRAGVKFRVASRQPADIAILGRRFVRERREGDDLRPLAPPAGKEMRIGEGEGGVPRQRDALPRRRQRPSWVGPRVDGSREIEDGGEIAMAFGNAREPSEARVEIAMLDRLHEAKMALGELHGLVAQDGARDG